MRKVTAFLIFFLLLSGACLSQVIAPKPGNSQLPAEILTGLIGKYMTMMQQYQYVIDRGGKPDSVIEFRLTASIDLFNSIEDIDSELEPVLKNLSKMVIWVNCNIFARYPSTVRVDLSGSFGNIGLLASGKDTFLISQDEAVFSIMPSDTIGESIPFISELPIDPTDLSSGSIEELQEQISVLLTSLSDFNLEYQGLKVTPEGMAHVVKITPKIIPNGDDSVITLWILDKTWDLCRIELQDLQSGISAIMSIKRIELNAPAFPDSTFSIDESSLSEIPYDTLVEILGLNLLSVVLYGKPVVVDLYTSSAKIRQGEQITVFSNGLDAKDEESKLKALIEYRKPGRTWEPLKASYSGAAPSGSWQAVFSATQTAGKYDFRVTYTNTFGAVSDPLEFPGALLVIAVPPRVVSISPGDNEKDVSASSKITVEFSQVMDAGSVEKAFSLMSAEGRTVSGSFQWSGKTMTFIPSQNLDYNTTYKVKIPGSVRSSQGAGLDTNKNGAADGSPADDLVWWFGVKAFPVLAVKPAKLSGAETITALKDDVISICIFAQSMSDLNSFGIDLDFDPNILKALNVEPGSFADWRPKPKFVQEADVWLPVVIDNEKGRVAVSASNTRTGGVSGSGIIATLAFQVVGVGETMVKFQNALLTNTHGENISPELRDGKIYALKASIRDVNNDGVVDILDIVAVVHGAKGSPVSVPLTNELGYNFPNPFNPETWIPYQLAVDADVAISIYNTDGQLVKSLNPGYKRAGVYADKDSAAYWDGTNEKGEHAASGVYFYNIKAGSFTFTKRMTVVR